MNKIIALWATPRSVSTAFEVMMQERGDFVTLHEPFSPVYYYSKGRLSHRSKEIDPQPEHETPAILQSIQAQAQNRPIFFKDMAYCIMHVMDEALILNFENTFLIRHPAKSLPSIYDKWPDFSITETGYIALHQMFELAKKVSGKTPAVIDADELVKHPKATVRAYCQATDIPFIAESLQWEASDRPEISYWKGGKWHTTVKSSRGFQEQARDYVTIDHNERLKEAYEICLPYYEKLYEQRLPFTK